MVKITRFILILVFLSIFYSCACALEINKNWQMFITNETEVGHNDVWGPGLTNSFLYRGNHGWYYEDRLDLLNRLTFDERLYEFDIETRFTNNEQTDIEDASPKKIYFKRESPDTFFQLGDLFANFSQYSLNQNLKGMIFSLKETPQNPWNISLVGGAYKSRWEYAWNDESDELKDTYFNGLRAGRKMGPLEAYLNYVFTHEYRLDDITANTGRSTTELLRNHLYSIDWRLRPATGLDLSGESAVSRNHSSLNFRNRDLGFAHLVRTRLRIQNLRTQFEFERTPSDFHTPGGSASSDRQRTTLRNNYYLGNNEIFVNYTSYWDNTQDTSTTTTKVKMPEAGITASNLLKRKSLSSTLKVRERRRHKSDNTEDERTNTVNLSLEDKFGPFRPNLEYEYRRVNPRKDINDSGERTHSFGFGINSYHRPGVWTLRPSLSVRNEHTVDLGSLGRGTNKDWLWSAGLGGTFKNDLMFNATYGYSQAINYAVDSNSRRKITRISLDYNVGGSRDNVLGVEFQDNRNSFSQGNNNYNENVWKFKWTKRF